MIVKCFSLFGKSVRTESIQLKDAQSGVVEGLHLRAILLGAVIENVKVDSAGRQRVIDGVAKNPKVSYVYSDQVASPSDCPNPMNDRKMFRWVRNLAVTSPLGNGDARSLVFHQRLPGIIQICPALPIEATRLHERYVQRTMAFIAD